MGQSKNALRAGSGSSSADATYGKSVRATVKIAASDKPVISLRQQSKIESRRKLLAAARKLFTTHGYDDTRPQDIAREAGVGYGTFYLHFADKHECFLGFAADVEGEFLQVLRWFWPEDDSSPATFFPAQLRAIFDYSLINPGVMRLALMDARVLSMVRDGGPLFGAQRMVDMMTAWQEAGHVSREFDTKLVSHLVLNSVKTAEKMVSRNPDAIEDIIANLTRFILGALRA